MPKFNGKKAKAPSRPRVRNWYNRRAGLWMLFPPVEAGDTVGRAVFYDGKDVLLGEVPLLARETVPGPEQSPGILERIFGGLRKPHLSDGR